MIAVIAQLVEHFLGKEEVTSSNLVNSSKEKGIHRQMGVFSLCRDRPDSNCFRTLVNSSKEKDIHHLVGALFFS